MFDIKSELVINKKKIEVQVKCVSMMIIKLCDGMLVNILVNMGS